MVTKIEQILHHCAWLYSKQRADWSIEKTCLCYQFWRQEWKQRGPKWPAERSEGSGNPFVWKRARREEGDGGKDGKASGMICVRPGFAKVTPGRHKSITAPVLVPSACCHTRTDTSHYLLMAFPGSPWQHSHYLWAGGPLQRLLMQPPKLSSLYISQLPLIKSEGSLLPDCCTHTSIIWGHEAGGLCELAHEGVNSEFVSRRYWFQSFKSELLLAQEQKEGRMKWRTERLKGHYHLAFSWMTGLSALGLFKYKKIKAYCHFIILIKSWNIKLKSNK